ncbi:MAG TPA: hypothetical protein VFH19_01585 [Nitrososphaeraceae archaeon]|jgi:hypothetical protein|nr:hypothetical protein [Nitrososphaeraceae archaeon]
MEREVERIVKYLVEERAVLKLLRILERQENHNYSRPIDEDNGLSYYSRKYKTWVLHNNCFQLN